MHYVFFFFFFNDKTYKIIKECLETYFYTKFDKSNYCDVSDLFGNIKREDLIKQVNIKNKNIDKLLKSNYPKSEKDLDIISELLSNDFHCSYNEYDVAFAILYWSFKIFKNKKPFDRNKSEIMNEFVEFLNSKFNYEFDFIDSMIYEVNSTLKYEINSVSDFLSALKDIGANNNCYFRGHSKVSYQLIPSIMRTESLVKNEKSIYQELIINCPQNFKALENRIDYLVEMQHYGLPTRLLDVTHNPLVALYFACCNNQNNIGEVIVFKPNKKDIKNYYSDTVAMLSALPLFSYDDQMNLIDNLEVRQEDNDIVERFIHEIKTEKPGFIDKIQFHDIINCFIVLPKKENDRIIKQDGAFFICGVNATPNKKINSKRLMFENKVPFLCISNKKNILQELDLLSINKSTLFPEIDYVAEYIKEKYNN